jgi:hypothetical protein
VAGPVVALCAAVASAATFGLSTSMQHLASSRIAGAPPHRLLMTLLRTPLWVLGMTLSVIAFALHALALSAGALVLVQPVIVTGVVFAVLIRAVLDRRAPSRAEVEWATVTWIGLAVFLIGTGSPAVAAGLPAHAGSAVAALVGAAALAAVAARRCREGSIGKGLWLGVVSGVLFGLVAVLLKLSLLAAAGGVTAVLSTWPPWVMVACGACAVLVNQRAYQTTRLSVSMPILNIVDVVVALLFASVVFGEKPALGPGALLTEAAGFVAMAIGVTKLARLEHEQGPPRAEELVLAPPSILDLQETSR